MLLAIALLMAGCADAPTEDLASMEDADGDGFIDAVEIKYGSDPADAESVPDVMVHVPASKSTSVQTVGTGVPSVQCPADAVNSQMVPFLLEAPAGGRDAHIADLVVKITGDVTVNDVDLFVYSPSGDLLGSGTSGANTETVEVPGHQETGEYQIEVRGCSGAGDVTVDASALIGWIPSDEELLEGQVDDGHEH